METKTELQTTNEIYQNITYILARYCAPTLLGQKPATMVHINKKSKQDRENICRFIPLEVGKFACQSSILYKNQAMVILLIYQAELLGNVLFREKEREFLKQLGYNVDRTDINAYITHFKKRYQDYWENGSAFPHEIGIFWDIRSRMLRASS